MRHTVLIENADMSFSAGIHMAEQIRRESGTEFLTVIAEGDFRSDGRPAEHSAAQRADGWMQAGADLVLRLPVFSTLGGYGKKDFATAALIQRLHSVDRVVLPCRPLPGQTAGECEALLRRCAMLMFREHPDYRKRLQENLRGRMSFQRAQMDAVICCVPEAAELLRFPENRQSVCMLDAMLQLYYLVQVEFRETADEMQVRENPTSDDDMVTCGEQGAKNCLRVEERIAQTSDSKKAYALMRLPLFEHNAAQGLKTTLETRTREFLMNISGSTEKAVDRIRSLSGEIAGKSSFREIAECVEDVFPNGDMARLFLLRALLNIRHSDMLISGLHTYVPYCRVLREREDRQEELGRVEGLSWVPFVRVAESRHEAEGISAAQDDEFCAQSAASGHTAEGISTAQDDGLCAQTDVSGQDGRIDETLRLLLGIDRRAEQLFE